MHGYGSWQKHLVDFIGQSKTVSTLGTSNSWTKIRSYWILTFKNLAWHDAILSTAARKKSFGDVEYLTVVMLDKVELSSVLQTFIAFIATKGTVNAAQTPVETGAGQTFRDCNDKSLTGGYQDKGQWEGERRAERKRSKDLITEPESAIPTVGGNAIQKTEERKDALWPL